MKAAFGRLLFLGWVKGAANALHAMFEPGARATLIDVGGGWMNFAGPTT